MKSFGIARMISNHTYGETVRFAVYDRFDNCFATGNGFVLGKDGKVSADLSQFVPFSAAVQPQLNFG